MNIIIKNGTLVRANETISSDLHIINGKIKDIASSISDKNAEIINADNQLVFPGAIDPHVHFGLQSGSYKTSDDFYTGSKAAIAGGTTTVIDFITPKPQQSFYEAFNERKRKARKSLVDYSFHLTPGKWSNYLEAEIRESLKEESIKSLKIYLAYKKSIGVNDFELAKLFDIAASNNLLLIAHCENGDLIDYLQKKHLNQGDKSIEYHAWSRPVEAEADAISKIIYYSQFFNVPVYIVHVSSKLGMDLIAKAKQNGLKIYAETCPHYLLLNDNVYYRKYKEASSYIVSPPLRKISDNEALWNYLSNKTIDTIGTDHCSFNYLKQKEYGKDNFTLIPNGAGGVEHRLELLYTYGVLTNKITINQMIAACATNPAQIFGLDHKKGDLKIGLDADIVIWDQNINKRISVETHFQNCDSNIYNGFKIKGKADRVFIKGELVYADNTFNENRINSELI